MCNLYGCTVYITYSTAASVYGNTAGEGVLRDKYMYSMRLCFWGIVKTRNIPDQTGPKFILHALLQASYLSTYIQRNDACLLKNIRAVFIDPLNVYIINSGVFNLVW